MFCIEAFKEKNIKEQIVENISSMIFNGVLNKGDFLPSIRAMSTRYCISRNTVVVAYKVLESLGYIEGRERSCYIVTGSAPQKQPLLYDKTAQQHTSLFLNKETARPAQKLEMCNRLHLHENAILPRHFIRKWCQDIRYCKEGNRDLSEADIIATDLKMNLKRFIKVARGSELAEENMLVTQGQQEAITVIAQFGKIYKTRPSIIIEDPAPSYIFQLFTCLGYDVYAVRVGREGLDVSAFPSHPVDFIYTTPSNHFPSGARMSEKNRTALLAWSRENAAFIIENDTNSMLGFGQDVIPPLREKYPDDNIIYLSSLSELIGNSTDLGLIVVPHHVYPLIEQIKSLMFSENQTLSNKIVTDFLGSNYFMKYLAKTLETRREKYQLALSGLKQVIACPDHWGMMHSGFFSFTAVPDTIPDELFFPLEDFCQKTEPLWDTPRYIYPVGTLSLLEIEKINKQLVAFHS